jgi:hypothetical protein
MNNGTEIDFTNFIMIINRLNQGNISLVEIVD